MKNLWKRVHKLQSHQMPLEKGLSLDQPKPLEKGPTKKKGFWKRANKPLGKGPQVSPQKPLGKGPQVSPQKPLEKGSQVSPQKPLEKGPQEKPLEKGSCFTQILYSNTRSTCGLV